MEDALPLAAVFLLGFILVCWLLLAVAFYAGLPITAFCIFLSEFALNRRPEKHATYS